MIVPIQDVSVFYAADAQPAEHIELVVTLPTFRRPDHLIRTLTTILAQTPGCPFAVIVMENDADGLEGAKAGRTFLEQHSLNAMIVVAHQRGNCHAYNAGFATALSAYPHIKAIAVIDDDEVAGPDWLARLVSTQAEIGADFVGGPQLPDFEDTKRNDQKRHPVFVPHYDATSSVPILYSSGNVLIMRDVFNRMPQPFLDPVFNFTGGGDSDFYRRSRAAGFRFAWCREAWVCETIPARRTQSDWIRARSVRNGALSALLEHRARPDLAGRLKTVLKSLALLAASPVRGLSMWRKTGIVSAGFYHFHVAIGRLMMEFGRVGEQYRNPEKN